MSKLFNSVKRATVAETIVEQVKELIIDGQLTPGQKLPSERELAEELKVGRSSVREATSALVALGVAQVRQGEGVFIRPDFPDSVIHNIEWSAYLLRGQMEDLIETRLAIVDTSADADIAAWCGAPNQVEDIENIQQVSCDYIACGVDSAQVVEWARENKDRLGLKVAGLEHENKEGGAQPMFTITIPGDDSDFVSQETFHLGWMPTVKLCIYREAVRIQGNSDIDPLDPRALTRAEVDGLRGAIDHLNFMKDNVPGFENAFIVSQAHLGVRESRQIIGDYFITIDDAKSEAHFDDVVALNCRALDYHLKGTVFKISHLERAHDIPLRVLLPQGVENLVVGGRCISCDHLSQASIRGAATCMATGHAAGASAAVAALNGQFMRDVDIRQIQRKLIEQDAILSVIEGREPWLGESVSVRESSTESLAAV